MHSKFSLVFIFLIMTFRLFSQTPIDEARRQLASATNDSVKVAAIDKIASYYRERNRDSAVRYYKYGMSLCEKNNQRLMYLRFKNHLGNQFLGKQEFAPGYEILSSVVEEAKSINPKNSSWLFYPDQPLKVSLHSLLSAAHYNLQILMQQTSNWDQAAYHLTLCRNYADITPEAEKYVRYSNVATGWGYVYLRREMLDSALYVLHEGERDPHFAEERRAFLNMLLGSVYADKQNYERAIDYLTRSVLDPTSRNTTTRSALRLSQVYQSVNNTDSAYRYAKMVLDTLRIFGSANYEVDLGLAHQNLYECFRLMKKEDSAYAHAQLAVHLNDSLSKLRIRNLKNFQVLSFTEQKRLEEINTERKNKLVRWTAYISIIIALLVGLIALFAYRNARLRKKTNLALLEQKQALESTLEKLKSTQSQLIQSEKMASLGELTAGIAHEIQNPLNFVNNFAELNTELHSELQEALQKGDQQEVKELSLNMQENEKKILLHGKRAGAIVKSMLEHSHGSKGTMEPTDLNKLTAEYLRLAYHGFKAKHEDQSPGFQLHEQIGLPPVPAVPQDLGKVLLNLFSNAFYAAKQKPATKENEPRVTVSTSMEGGRATLTVKDNGIGIPESIQHKIFQPFFTTKPTGEGTGLGLSLSYDIVKAHGGEIRVESKEGEGSTFTLVLPVVDDKTLLS